MKEETSLKMVAEEANQGRTCHLKRSNAIRIKARNNRQNMNGSAGPQEEAGPQKREDCSGEETMLEQIKRGVRLRRVGEITGRQHEPRQDPSTETEDENLSLVLARVLEKRNSVMQLTDDESDLSSIDSQPDSLDDSYQLIRCLKEQVTDRNRFQAQAGETVDLVVKL